ncbi:MAG: hypothetical protein HYV63_26590 [Candidatus Schekmanbacteria bacterium]|nr:hypothetical protein [Candidatus Schekmanbacteria bacterium]
MTMIICADAVAYTGYVSGKVSYYDKRFNLSYATSDWVGARHMKVYVVEKNGGVLGKGATDGSGSFSVAWSSPKSAPVAHVEFRYESSYADADGKPRFKLVPPEGGKWVSSSKNVTLPKNETKKFGSLLMGTKSNPHKLGNMFATATDVWENAANTSNNLTEQFGAVKIYWPVNSASTGRTNSRTEVQMPDSNFAYNASTLAHELGHVIHLIAWETDTWYYTCKGGHSWDSSETETCAFMEGWANFVAAVTYYGPAAAGPQAYGNDVEGGTCSGADELSESNVSRYFWDLYDDHGTDTANQPFYWFVDKMNFFAKGTGSRQDQESKSKPETGSNAWDFYWNAKQTFGDVEKLDNANLIHSNCLDEATW